MIRGTMVHETEAKATFQPHFFEVLRRYIIAKKSKAVQDFLSERNMRWVIRALPLLAGLVWRSNGQGSSSYYGLPLGSIFYSSTSTQGEVYVSEPRKLTIVNFQHAAEAGCTTFMVGPPVQGVDVSVSPNKEGVILAIETKRRKRQSSKSGEKQERNPLGIASRNGGTVIQLGDPPSKLQPLPQASTPRTGIVWGDQSKTQETISNRRGGASSEKSAGIRWGDIPAEKPKDPDVIKLGGGGGDAPKRPSPKLRELPVEYFGGLNIPDDEEGKNNPNITALLRDPFNPDRPIIPVNRGPTEPPRSTAGLSNTILFGGGKHSTISSPIITEEPGKTFRGLPLSPGASPPGASPPATDNAIPKLGGEGGSPRNATEQGNRTECGNGWCIVPDPRRRAPTPINGTAPSPPVASASTSPPQLSNDSHPWVVVEDRRAQFLPPEVIEKLAPAQLIATKEPQQDPDNKGENNLPVISQPAQESTVRYTPPPLPQDGKVYSLPRFNGENINVLLPEPYELSAFQWFGIYDHCRRVRTAFVNVRGIQPPKEAKLEKLRGWQYDVGSGDIYVKNCNTLLITNFTFNGAGKTEAYIFVGNGAFPHSIIQKARAIVDGTFPDRALPNYNNEDVLVRLPNGWKTFDITWLAVFNPKGNVSYGHVLLPPLVVPACEGPK